MESMTVIVAPEALRQADDLPRIIHGRVVRIVQRLANWPAVSGAKPLRHGLAGSYRVRTGDYRVQFRVQGQTIIVEKIGHRDGFYED
jgi:mRNA-degrading endonuclease RelE of RelBE toxin-antitoxin system